MHLTETIRRSFPGVRSVSLVAGGDGPDLAIAVVADDVADRGAIASALVRAAAVEGVLVYPAVYGEGDWNRLQPGTPPASLGGDAAAVTAALDARAGAGGLPARRDAAVALVRSYRLALDAIADAQPLLPHLSLWLAAHVVRRATELLFATRQRSYPAGVAGVAAFDAEFAAHEPFGPQDATLPLRLVGSARQAEQAFWRDGSDAEGRFAGAATVDEARAFLRAVEAHVQAALTSDAERAASTRRRRFAYAMFGPLLLLVAFVQHWLAHPEPSLADVSVITNPGFIAGEYFSGENFDRKVFDRNDNQVALGPDDPLTADVGAEHYSVRWAGYIQFDQPGRWHLCAKVHDRVRVVFNQHPLIEEWEPSDGSRTRCGSVQVERGWYPLRVEYADVSGPPTISLLRGPPRRGLEAVPPWVLCCSKDGARPPASAPPLPGTPPS